MDKLVLAPYPHQLHNHAGEFNLISTAGYITIPSYNVLFEAQWLKDGLERDNYHYQIALDVALADADKSIQFKQVEGLAEQAYHLRITNQNIIIEYTGKPGLFYGVATLRQIIQQCSHVLPCLEIHDEPDFAQRGFMLDISRDRVPTMPTLLQLIDELAALKYNQLQLYIEHTFAYPQHQVVWEHASPLTSEELLTLDAYCRQRHIDLVPNQNSLGHMERWLKHDAYRDLSETPEGFEAHDGRWRSPSTLNPLDPASLQLINELYDVFLPHFSSALFNVGCDEPWELGRGKSKAAGAEEGRVYLDWLLALHKTVTQREHKMMFWGDIIIKYPHLIPELPEDVIVMEWGYEATHPFDENCQKYAEAGIPFYVCPGTSSWNGLVGRADNAIGNLKNAAKYGLKHGAQGYLVTDWGDNGHWQPSVASHIGIVYGAGVSWCYEQNQEMDVAAVLNTNLYHDARQHIGQVILQITDIYREIGPEHINGQLMAYALQWPKQELQERVAHMEAWGGESAILTPETLRQTIATLHELKPQLRQTRLSHPDAELILQEWEHATNLLIHGGKWLLLAQEQDDYPVGELQSELETLISKQRELWLSRSRRGGLEDSMARFNLLREEYQKLGGYAKGIPRAT